jgi:hypothetical protein
MRVYRSATKRVLFGSAALTATAVGFAGAGLAQTAGDAAQSSAYHGPYLTWAGKNAVPPSATAPQPALAPMPTPAQEFASWPAPAVAPKPAPTPQPAYIAPPTQRPAAVAAYAAPPVAQPPPHAVHAAYVAPPVAQPPPKATHAAYVAPPPTPATPPRKHHAAAQVASAPTAATAPAQPAAPAQTLAQNNPPAPTAAISSPSHVHYYSLHREYGLTPDKVAAPKDQPMVLIGPPDNPPAQKDDSNDGGKTDKHGDSEGADD